MILYQPDDPAPSRPSAPQRSSPRSGPAPSPNSPAWAAPCTVARRTPRRVHPPRRQQRPIESLNLKIKNTKRVARGYRNFTNYRLRLLLNHGRTHEDHSPTRIRTRRPSFAA
jgi:hypothetical protein